MSDSSASTGPGGLTEIELSLEGGGAQELVIEKREGGVSGAGEATRVDLGEDLLLEATRQLNAPASSLPSGDSTVVIQLRDSEAEAEVAPEDESDALAATSLAVESEARIFSEPPSRAPREESRSLESEKRRFQRALLLNPEDLQAREGLAVIQKREVEDLLATVSGVPRSGEADSTTGRPSSTAERLLADLELFQSSLLGKLVAQPKAVKRVENAWLEELRTRVPPLQARDRVDLAIALAEAEHPAEAITLLQEVIDLRQVGSEDFRVCGFVLAELALESARPFDALRASDLLLVEVASDSRPDFRALALYLRGRALEALDRGEEALLHFRQVASLLPDFRDVSERLKGLVGSEGESP